MTLVRYDALIRTLEQRDGEGRPNIYLICGEPFLVRQAFDRLTGFLLRGQSRQFALETLDGRSTSVGDIIEQVTTFSFLQSEKIIAVKDAPLFSTKAAQGEISYSAKELEHLASVAEKGIPDNHILVLTTQAPDKRKKIFKTINEKGWVIDCTVATGSRKADLDEQASVLRDLTRSLLSGSGKQLEPRGFDLLVAQTGFNLELVAGNIEKLLAYTGSRNRISDRDVMAVVHRDKKDPIFSLTNAVLDREAPKAMTLLSGLFAEGYHPLQILKTLENQIRKTLVVKFFLKGLYRNTPGLPPMRTMQFNGFKQAMLPRIVEFDKASSQRMQEWDGMCSDDEAKGKKGPSGANDLLLAPNPKNAYPVFQNFLKSENFSLDELRSAMTKLSDLDYGLKTSAVQAQAGIEFFIMNLCRKGGRGA